MFGGVGCVWGVLFDISSNHMDYNAVRGAVSPMRAGLRTMWFRQGRASGGEVLPLGLCGCTPKLGCLTVDEVAFEVEIVAGAGVDGREFL